MRVLQFLVLSIAFLSLPSFAAIGPQNLWGYIDKQETLSSLQDTDSPKSFTAVEPLPTISLLTKLARQSALNMSTESPSSGMTNMGFSSIARTPDRSTIRISGKFCDGLAPMVPNASPCVCVCVLCRVRAARRRPTECRNSAIDRYTLTFSIFDYASVIAGAQCHAINVHIILEL